MDEYIDLAAVTLYALAASSVATFAGLTGALALLIQAPVVFLLPGYAIMAAALPSSSLDRLERLTLYLALSLAVTILGGLALNLTPFGLGKHSWSLLLTVVIVVGTAVALLRRICLRAASGRGVSLSPALVETTAGSRARLLAQSLRLPVMSAWRRACGLGLALLIVAGAIIFSNQSAIHQPYPGFTQLWMIPGQANNGEASVQIGIVNDEASTMSYTLVLERDQETFRRITGISLARHGVWEDTILVVPGSKQILVEGDLYLAGRAAPVYRSVKVWISPAGNGT